MSWKTWWRIALAPVWVPGMIVILPFGGFVLLLVFCRWLVAPRDVTMKEVWEEIF